MLRILLIMLLLASPAFAHDDAALDLHYVVDSGMMWYHKFDFRIQGGAWNATMVDHKGRTATRSGKLTPDEWKDFRQRVIALDPWGVKESKEPQPKDLPMYTIAVKSALGNSSVRFYGMCDAKHEGLMKFLGTGLPDRIAKELMKELGNQ